MEAQQMKTCTKCGETKPLDAFANDKTRKSGHYTRCKSCRSEDHKQYRQRKMAGQVRAHRPAGTGSIYKGKDGIWHSILLLPNNKKKTHISRTEQEALAWLEAAHYAVQNGLPIGEKRYRPQGTGSVYWRSDGRGWIAQIRSDDKEKNFYGTTKVVALRKLIAYLGTMPSWIEEELQAIDRKERMAHSLVEREQLAQWLIETQEHLQEARQALQRIRRITLDQNILFTIRNFFSKHPSSVD